MILGYIEAIDGSYMKTKLSRENNTLHECKGCSNQNIFAVFILISYLYGWMGRYYTWKS